MHKSGGEGYIRPMESSDIASVLGWRNSPEIRRYMYTQHEISIEEHIKWFNSASKDPFRHLLIFEIEGISVGFVNIHVNKSGRVADWGFYVAPDAERGAGRKLGRAVITYAFKRLKLHKLNGEALEYNEKSISFHERLGFRKEGLLRDQHFDGKCYHDVLCFGLLSNEWDI